MRSNRWNRLVAVGATTALAAGIALLAPANLAQAASTVTVTGPTSTVAVDKNLVFNFAIGGDATDGYYGITVLSSRVGTPTVPGNPTPAGTLAAGTLTVPIATTTSPGKYRVAMQAYEGTTPAQLGYADFTVLANTTYSRSLTRSSISGKVGPTRRTTFKVWAPSYQVGAKATVYYKFKGKKKYVKVAKGKLNSSGYAKMLTKKGKVRKAGRYYVKIGGVTYAAGYKTKTVKTYIRTY